MPGKTALIVGATGLIGAQVLQLLLEDDYYDRVIAINRRELPIENDKLYPLTGDFEDLQSFDSELKADDVFCCLGTTMKKAGTKEQFFKIDHDYPLRVAQLCHAKGAQEYLLVSALGADKHSKVYYNQVKGQVEEAIGSVGFKSFHVFQPSLLLGPRTEKRVGEDAAKSFFKVFNFLFVGPLKKYRAIDSDKVARAMVKEAKGQKAGLQVYGSALLQEY